MRVARGHQLAGAFQGFSHRFAAVIDAWKKMGMDVDSALFHLQIATVASPSRLSLIRTASDVNVRTKSITSSTCRQYKYAAAAS
jgi:hypothetical protein